MPVCEPGWSDSAVTLVCVPWCLSLRQRRTVIPGLYEEYIPQGVCGTKFGFSKKFFISYQPVGPYAGRAAIIVTMDKANDGAPLKITRLLRADGRPFTGNARDITTSNHHLFTSDDTYDPYVPCELKFVAAVTFWLPTRLRPRACCSAKYIQYPHRNALVLAYKITPFIATGAPNPSIATALSSVEASAEWYSGNVIPSALFYDRDGRDFDDLESDITTGGLWVAEYHEPLSLGADGIQSEGQDIGDGTAKACSTQETTKPEDAPPSTAEDIDRLSSPQPGLYANYSNQKPRRSNKPALAPPSTRLWDKTWVDRLHCDQLTEQCGMAAMYPMSNSPNLPEELEVDRILFIGEGVRGIAVFTQIGRRYMAVERCSNRPGYVCRVEFHRVDDLEVDDTIPLYMLDPGAPPSIHQEFVDTFDYMGDIGQYEFANAEDEDGETNNPATRCNKKRKSQKSKKSSQDTKKKDKKSKKKGGSKDKKKTVKISGKGTSGDVVNPDDLGQTTTMSSAFRIPAGSCSLDIDNNGGQGLLFMSNSAAKPFARKMQLAGHALDDSVHFMTMPSVAAEPLTADQNILFVVISTYTQHDASVIVSLTSARVCMRVRAACSFTMFHVHLVCRNKVSTGCCAVALCIHLSYPCRLFAGTTLPPAASFHWATCASTVPKPSKCMAAKIPSCSRKQ